MSVRATPSGQPAGGATPPSPAVSAKGAHQAQFTPGPWSVAYDDPNGQAVVKGEHIEIATCWHHSVGSIEREMRANANLIAASPELLAVCERMLPRNVCLTNSNVSDRSIVSLDVSIGELRAVAAAVANARGEVA